MHQITGIITELERPSRSGDQVSAWHGVYRPPCYIPRYIAQEVFVNDPLQVISHMAAQVNGGSALTSPPVYQMVHVRTEPQPPSLHATQFMALPSMGPGASSPGTKLTPLATRSFKCFTPTCQKSFDRYARADACHNRHLKAQPYVCRGVCGNQNCPSAFASIENLQRHTRPANERVALCPTCQRKVLKQNLARHKATHHTGQQSAYPLRNNEAHPPMPFPQTLTNTPDN